jgi:cob(I)alamin adenosyltransferase
VPAVALTYLNRLSDWLFVQARWANAKAKVRDVEWEKEKSD